MGVITETHGELKSPPLVYTLLMLRFPVQTALDERISKIQEALKHIYPIYEKRVQQGIEVIQSNDGQTIRTIALPEHMFFDSDRAKGVLLKEDRIIFHSSLYPNFEEFSSWFKEVAEPIVDILSISHYLGCGIRYIDALIPSSDTKESLTDYLQSSLLSFDMDDGTSECISSNQVNVYKTSLGAVTFKSYILYKEDDCVPPDLRDLSSLLRFKSVNKKTPFAVLDFDHAYAAPDGTAEKLNLDRLIAKIDDMHNVASSAFLKAVNSDAIQEWK